MIDKVIANIDEVSTTWLTSVLVKSGALTYGSVESFELGKGKGNWSTNAKVSLKYTDNAKGLLPKRLFLKMVDTDLGDGRSFDDSEVTYYTQDYADLNNAPLLRCYSAKYAKEHKRYHLLLDDASETHVTASEKEPTLEYGLVLADGLAVLHARWWGANQLAEAGLSMHNSSDIQEFVDIAARGVEHICNHFSRELESHWRANLHEIFVEHPQVMMKRMDDPNGFTIIHGDVGSANILVPRQGNYPVYIIDRQPFNWSLTLWLGVYDLAYAMVLDWEIETRRRHEIPILKRYHESLMANGVHNYTWEQLYRDYKICIVMGVYIATEYFRGGVNGPWTHVWLSMLQRALTACDDLDCYMIWRGNNS
jgi:hypothetical protein